jgi:hypothetical protein
MPAGGAREAIGGLCVGEVGGARLEMANLALTVPRAVAPCHLHASVEQRLDRRGV